LTEPKLTDNEKVLAYIKENLYSSAAEQLLKIQLNDWGELAEGYNRLNKVKTKSYLFNGFQFKLQLNPGRMKSTSAEVNDSAINKRTCFLCADNLPAEQRGIKLLDKFILLCNPYPVFPNHFTIASITHRQQEIKSSFTDFILLGKMLSEKYSLIYNGPKCGASAPDHLHFQAGTKEFIPIDNDFHSIENKYGKEILNNKELSVTSVDDGLRRFISYETRDENILRDSFDQFYEIYSTLKSEEEPMMNIICNYEKEFGWRVIIFLRSKHRSSHYYFEDEEKITISPAAIDLGGVCITPVEKDCVRIDKAKLTDIIKEVSLQRSVYEKLTKALKEKYN
jgi:ATP adenylyltransferase/5',5'''-P-1,P-4-tetraphosphate phosphorylase II